MLLLFFEGGGSASAPATNSFGTVTISDHAYNRAVGSDHNNGRVEIVDNPIGTVRVQDSRVN